MYLNKNSFDVLLIFFLFYTRNSLEKQAENSGVFIFSWSKTRIFAASTITQYFFSQCNHHLLDERDK